jgi:hypothetical protein
MQRASISFHRYSLSTTYDTKDQLPARVTKALNAWGCAATPMRESRGECSP